MLFGIHSIKEFSLEHWEIRVGNALEELKKIPNESIQTVVTSPPYWGLRDYGTGTWEGGSETCEHVEGASRNDTDRVYGSSDVVVEYYKDKCAKCGAIRYDSQLGAEDTYQEYVDNMVEVFREVRRVLKNDGTLWLNLGDSYMSAYNTSPPPQTVGGQRGMPTNIPGNRKKQPGVKHKDLVGIPWRVALALQEDGWWLRSDIIWHKPNPMPESVKDRPTKSHEYIFLLTKNPRYYYDADAIREPVSDVSLKRAKYSWDSDRPSTKNASMGGDGIHTKKMGERFVNPRGRNKRSVWTVNTKAFLEAHFATFPEKLIDTCIKAGTSEIGQCPDCGKCWERKMVAVSVPKRETRDNYVGVIPGRDKPSRMNSKDMEVIEKVQDGWERTCGHTSEPLPQIVLDPFSGSGTTGVVACKNNRSYIGIELNPEYAQISMKRLAKEVGATEEQASQIDAPGVQSSML